MEITGNISEVNYFPFLARKAKEVDMNVFDINTSPVAIVIYQNIKYAVSKWVSPKRTRSYPYQRVYDTLAEKKRITVIPVIKDEGKDGDYDILQWDTVSLMSLLNVYVILAYYDDAELNKTSGHKIAKQKFNNEFVKTKIKEIESLNISTFEWNNRELNENILNTLDLCRMAYRKISRKLNVEMHSEDKIDNFKNKIGYKSQNFCEFSRRKSRQAQSREIMIDQPKEHLFTNTKAKITITDNLGGEYFLTLDEVAWNGKDIEIIECANATKDKLPNDDNIKDGLFKMILYANMKEVKYNDIKVKATPVFHITSKHIKGEVDSTKESYRVDKFCDENKLDRTYISKLFKEAQMTNFIVRICGVI